MESKESFNKHLSHEIISVKNQKLLDREYTNFPTRGKILVVDNDPFIRETIESLFTKEGYSVWTLDNPLKFIDFLNETRPDIVIMDIVMLGMYGYKTLDLIKKKHEELAILLLSNNPNIEERIEALKAGADDYIAKPFDSKELLTSVEIILKSKLFLKGINVLRKNCSTIHLLKLIVEIF